MIFYYTIIFHIQTLQLPETRIEYAKEYGFEIKQEPDNDEPWYSNEVIQQCNECDEKEKYRQHLELCHKQKMEELETKVEELVKERNDLIVQLKKYQTSDEYTVENIIKHKITKKGQKFLVHWKGYDNSEDSWVTKENMNCSSLLKKYMKANNLV